MAQAINNGVTTDAGSRYNIRDGSCSRDRETLSRTKETLNTVSPTDDLDCWGMQTGTEISSWITCHKNMQVLYTDVVYLCMISQVIVWQ